MNIQSTSLERMFGKHRCNCTMKSSPPNSIQARDSTFQISRNIDGNRFSNNRAIRNSKLFSHLFESRNDNHLFNILMGPWRQSSKEVVKTRQQTWVPKFYRSEFWFEFRFFHESAWRGKGVMWNLKSIPPWRFKQFSMSCFIRQRVSHPKSNFTYNVPCLEFGINCFSLRRCADTKPVMPTLLVSFKILLIHFHRSK